MTCESVMLTDPVTVPDTATLGQAIKLLLEHQIQDLPLVDAQGRYCGLFGMRNLVRQLLPRAATLNAGASLGDLGFVHDNLAAVQERLAGKLNDPVIDYADRELQPVAPDTSLMETLLLLYRQHHLLPVVDGKTGHLAGIVTYWNILARLNGQSA